MTPTGSSGAGHLLRCVVLLKICYELRVPDAPRVLEADGPLDAATALVSNTDKIPEDLKQLAVELRKKIYRNQQ